MLLAHGVSHPGRVRKTNEDALLCEPALGLFVVADGMGGHNAGEVASGLAVEAIRSFLERTREGDVLTWPYGINPGLSFEANRLLTSVKLANRRVFKASESLDEYTGMGTTVVAALIEGERVVYCSVGDSRLYALTAGALTQLTRDDSWVETVLTAGGQGFDEAALTHHPMRHVLTNVVGAREQMDADVVERVLADGEILLLCSDGLHGALEDSTLQEVLSSGREAQGAAERLVELALERDGSDNVSAIVVQYRA